WHIDGSYYLNNLPTISHENEIQKVTLIAAIVTTFCQAIES
ncbi:MAG: hypothetical protein US83_C0003G0111, partial [Candidatus Falkowbacteria bacterium GW2011_GWC2_38_22]